MEPTPPDHDGLHDLSLHTISERYGTEGLQARFELEVQRFSPEDQERLREACAVALELHEGQQRGGGQPYADHLLRVATRIMSPDHYGSDDVDLVIAGLLHDSVEDQEERLIAMGGDAIPEGLTGKEAALWVVGQRFNEDIASTVRAVTNPEFDKSGDWQAEYRQHVHDALMANPKARVIKLSDFTDNAIGINYSPEERLPHYARKYAPMVPSFREFVLMPDTPLSDASKQHILGQLDAAEERFAAILQQADGES